MSLNALSIIKARRSAVGCPWRVIGPASGYNLSLSGRASLSLGLAWFTLIKRSLSLKRALSCLHQPRFSQAPPKKVLGKVVFPEPLVGTCHHAILLTYASSWREAHGGSCSCYANYQKVRLAGYFRYGLRLVSKVIRCFEAAVFL